MLENDDKIIKVFNDYCKYCEENGQSQAIAAIKTLINFIKTNNYATINNLMIDLKNANKLLEERVDGKSKLAITSACAQFLRFATLNLATIEAGDMTIVKSRMEEEGRIYLDKCESSKKEIIKFAHTFIFDGARVLIHSNSRVVLETLKAVGENTQFKVYIAISSGGDNYKNTLGPNVTVEIINEGEIGYIMETIDLVLCGAEAVVKNGGILNKVGTLSLAICAKEMNKPLYVLAESFKFSLLYPLNQCDIPSKFRLDNNKKVRIDYTPPKYLTLLVTDRGLLTPTAVCDELIEMYV